MYRTFARHMPAAHRGFVDLAREHHQILAEQETAHIGKLDRSIKTAACVLAIALVGHNYNGS